MRKRYDCMNCYRRNAVITVHSRDLWKQAEEQRRLLQEATRAIVALTRALQSCGIDALADNTAALDEAESFPTGP